MTEGPAGLPEDVIEDLVADEGCRAVLSHLAAREDPATVDDLARALAAREAGVPEDAVADEAVTTHREALFQRHLPKLTPTGVVEYDSLLCTVALDTDDERLRSRLQPFLVGTPAIRPRS